MKIKVTFSNHAPLIFTLDELVSGKLYLFCMVKNQEILRYETITETENLHLTF